MPKNPNSRTVTAMFAHGLASRNAITDEVFAPFLEGFPYKASECKFLGDPIDYIVFEGLDERDIKAIHFVEVKSGKSKLNDVQKQIKNLLNDINSDKVSFKRFDFKDD